MFLSCGDKVTIYSQLVGYGMRETVVTSPLVFNFSVQSWTNDQQSTLSEAEVLFFL